ncbi:MAG: hypothetical protein LAQ69_42175 [Acidobacteriia bacterium]|nr:hypothetical protein [Terriglobia bacterium]
MWSKRIVLIGLTTFWFIPNAFAQDVPGTRTGTVELGALLGASYGTDNFRVMGGGNVSYALSSVFLPYVEFSYFPGLPRQATKQGDTLVTTDYSLPLYDFHGGLHVAIPLPSRRIVPYGVVGIGVIHNLATTYQFNYTILGKPQTDNVTVSPANNVAANFGGGLRLYLNEHFGLRFEGKAYKVAGDVTHGVFSKYEFGVFYQTVHRTH